jgi:hypothetical protein
MAANKACRAGGPINYVVFFCTDESFGIEMAQGPRRVRCVDPFRVWTKGNQAINSVMILSNTLPVKRPLANRSLP